MTKYRTVEDLKRHEWWWGCDDEGWPERFNPKHYVEVFREQIGEDDEKSARAIFKAAYSESAWIYEGHRRLYARKRPRYCDLPVEKMDLLAEKHPCWDASIVDETIPSRIPARREGWTKFLVASFNLAANDSKLVREFKRFIEGERRRLKIRPKRNEGVPLRSREFTPWETWDRIHRLKAGVSESAKKTLERAEEEIPAELLLVEE